MHYVQLSNNGNVDGDGDIKPYTLKSLVFSLVLILVEALALHSSNYFVCIRSFEPSVDLSLSTYSFTYVE